MPVRIKSTKTMEFRSDVFIIPNNLVPLSKLNQAKQDFCKEVADMNGIGALEPDDLCVQLWMASDVVGGVGVDNISNHGFTVTGSDGETMIDIFPTNLTFLPVELFLDVREGDTVRYEFPYEDPKEGEIIMIINLTFKQESYRYKQFGKFQTLLLNLIQQTNKED